MNNGDELAFGKMKQAGNVAIKDGGLTKREYFSAMAMQGLIASIGQHDVTNYDEIAHDAVLASDALLKELKK